MHQNAGEKGLAHPNPQDPPRRRANSRRGHGTWDNDRPPIIGVIGHQSGYVTLSVVANSDTLSFSLEKFINCTTSPNATLFTDEWRSYNFLDGATSTRRRQCVSHSPGKGKWARDEDGDGVREAHTNTIEEFWTGLRNFLRPFRGVSKHYLQEYVCVYAWLHNFEWITPQLTAFILRPFMPQTLEPKKISLKTLAIRQRKL
jgi:transposase